MLLSLIVGLVCVLGNLGNLPPAPSSSSGLKCEEWLKKLKELRLSKTQGQSVVWYYTGVIRNPVSGAEVVGIEGVERCVEVPETFLQTIKNEGEGGHAHDGGAKSFSFLSSKLFAYTDLQNRTKPVTLFRVQPAAPARPVNPLSELNSIVTLGYRRRGASQEDSADDVKGKGKGNREGIVQRRRAPFDFFSVVRWPSGRAIHTNKIDIAPAGSNDVMGSRRVSDRRGIDVIHYINGISASKNVSMSTKNLGGEAALGAQQKKGKFNWKKWVTFSGSGSQPWHGKSQEYYTISAGGRRGEGGRRGGFLGLTRGNSDSAGSKPPLATMHYKRFGEGPEWYAMGRPCSTELYAYKYASMQDVPVSPRAMLAELCPTFFLAGDAPGRADSPSSPRREKPRGPAIFVRMQEQARLKLVLRDAAKNSPAVGSSGSSAVARAEADILDNINKAKRLSPPSEKAVVGEREKKESKEKKKAWAWGTPEAFRGAVDMRASPRFVPWYEKLPSLLSKKPRG
jgi:hypothetical protein